MHVVSPGKHEKWTGEMKKKGAEFQNSNETELDLTPYVYKYEWPVAYRVRVARAT
jgi:hypothetical protein